jgi:Fe-S cluster biogenesis protein NfuA
MKPATNLKDRIGRILTEEAGPALELDGSAIEVLDASDGVVRIRLGSVCGRCPSTLMTVIHGIEEQLRRRFPEVKSVEVLP